MTSSSVSFRISRHTQDLAETVHALSQRLVSLEQRLELLDGHLQALRQRPRQDEQEEAASLAPVEAHIERLLQDCRQLLADRPSGCSEPSGLADLEDEGEVDRPFQDIGEAPDLDDEPVDAAAQEDPDEDVLDAAHAA